MNIRDKMAKGVFWLFVEKGSQQVSSIIVFAVIARIIGPEDYGYVALCAVFISLAINCINSLVDAVISMQIKDDLRLSTLFWTVTCCGIALSLFAYGASDLFAHLMGEPRIGPLLRYFSVLPFLLALVSVPSALVTATMDFRVFALRTLVATIIGGTVGILLALKGFGAYSLALQQIVFYVLVNLVVWPSCGWRPRFIFRLASVREILYLGVNQAGSSFISFFDQQAPRLVLGFVLNPVAVGQYAFVVRLCSAVQDGLIQPILTVIYPAFSQIRDEPQEQKKILSQLITIIAALLLPALAGVIFTAPVFVPLIFGERWESTVPLLQLYMLTEVGTSFSLVLRDYLRSHKMIGAFLRLQVAIVCVGFITGVVLAYDGMKVFICGNIAITWLALALYTMLVRRKTGIALSGIFIRQWAPLLAAAIMVAVLLLLRYLLPASHPALLLPICIILGGAAYGTAYAMLQRQQFAYAVTLLKSRIRKPETDKVLEDTL